MGGLVAVAAGNHVRKRGPTARAAIRLTGLGGVACFLALFLESKSYVHTWHSHSVSMEDEPVPGIALLLSREEWKQAWPVLLECVLALAFAFMGARAFSSTHVARRCAWTSRVGRCLLGGHPIALFALLSLGTVFIDLPLLDRV